MDQAKADAILAKITTGIKDICTDCDLVVEAAIENLEIKKQTFKELSAICKPDCIFATNTSSLSITAIGAGLDRPVIGMHLSHFHRDRQGSRTGRGSSGLCGKPYPYPDDQ